MTATLSRRCVAELVPQLLKRAGELAVRSVLAVGSERLAAGAARAERVRRSLGTSSGATRL